MMIVKLQEHFPLRVTDWLLGGIMTCWGFACLYMSDTSWALPSFSGLRAFASQETWGMTALLVGIARMIALFINGAVRRTPHVRGFGAFICMFIWLQLSFGMFTASVVTTGIAVYPWLFLADIYNVYRASQDARDSDMRFKAKAQEQRITGDAVRT